MKPAHFPVAQPVSADIVLERLASAIEAAADDLARIEHEMLSAETPRESLQAFDALGQELRALARFVGAVNWSTSGAVALDEALAGVCLDKLRAHLAGDDAPAPAPDVELW
ncbi:MAG TPA: hypothetical protein VG841_15165 [Caulobacterales bacterium]|nr:hypothetical protein [Caulobacterales bacterium]